MPSNSFKSCRSEYSSSSSMTFTELTRPEGFGPGRAGIAYAASRRESAVPFRSTDQATSGRRSSQVTAPAVASSIAGQRSAGTRRTQVFHCEMSTSPFGLSRPISLASSFGLNAPSD